MHFHPDADVAALAHALLCVRRSRPLRSPPVIDIISTCQADHARIARAWYQSTSVHAHADSPWTHAAAVRSRLRRAVAVRPHYWAGGPGSGSVPGVGRMRGGQNQPQQMPDLTVRGPRRPAAEIDENQIVRRHHDGILADVAPRPKPAGRQIDRGNTAVRSAGPPEIAVAEAAFGERIGGRARADPAGRDETAAPPRAVMQVEQRKSRKSRALIRNG